MEIQSFTEGSYYHIYNRGVNGENIFFEDKNYDYFIRKYEEYCADILDTFAYCLLKNHFHLLVFVKENVQVPRRDGKGIFTLSASRQLSHFFNAYAQAINKMYHRTGPLFESPFERVRVEDKAYAKQLVSYIHCNPQLHGFTDNFQSWPFSSHSYYSTPYEKAFIKSGEVMDWFGSKTAFDEAHKNQIRSMEESFAT